MSSCGGWEHSSVNPVPTTHGSLSCPCPVNCATSILLSHSARLWGATSLPRNGVTESSADSTLAFPLGSKRLQTGDFWELKSLVSAYAVLREPLIILQIFLESLVNELRLRSCGNSAARSSLWSPVLATLCHSGARPTAAPQPSTLNTLRGHLLRSTDLHGYPCFPPHLRRGRQGISPQETQRTPSGYACEVSALQAPQSFHF